MLKSKIYQWMRKAYFKMPLKPQIFKVLRSVYTPAERLAGLLKFKGVFSLKLDGKKLRIFNNNNTVATLVFWRGVKGYEPETIAVWRKLSASKVVALDIGANWGLFGLITKALNPASELHFFEPLERNANLVKKNLQVNNFSASVEVCAMSDKSGQTTFYDMANEENTIGSFNRDFIASHAHAKEIIPITVNVISLDDYIEKNKITNVDIIKIDVEGHEAEVLKGADNTLRRFMPSMIIEISDHNKDTINAQLNSLGYAFYIIDEDGAIIKTSEIARSDKGRNYLVCKPGVVEQVGLI